MEEWQRVPEVTGEGVGEERVTGTLLPRYILLRPIREDERESRDGSLRRRLSDSSQNHWAAKG